MSLADRQYSVIVPTNANRETGLGTYPDAPRLESLLGKL